MLGRGTTDFGAGKTLHQRCTKMLDQARKARRPYDAEAWLNIAFFLGEQYTEWVEDSNSIRRKPRRPANASDDKANAGETDLPRPVINKIQHFIYTAHAETLQDKPSLDVLPATDDYQDIVAQDVNKAYLNFTMEPVNMNWDLQLSAATLWALIAPSGWLKFVWDPVLKRVDAIPIPFFDLTVDPFVLNQPGGFARARYAIHSQFMDPDVVQEVFGVTLDKAEIGYQDAFKTELLRGMGSAVLSQGVEVHELWHKPTKRHPKGFRILFTNRRILKMDNALPYEHLTLGGGMLPFIQLGALMRPDSMYYTCPVTALRPSQIVWNKFVAQTILIQENYAAPKWWIPEELQMKNMPNSAPHQILRGNAGNTGLKPEMIAPPAMPDTSRVLDLFEKQMMHVVSVHEVSQGQVPGRVEAAKAIELLQTSDKGRYKHLLDTIDQGISVGGWHVLMLAKQFETPEKMVMTYSREGIPQVKRWKKEAVQPGLRVRVVRMGGLGRTRAERQDTLLLYWQNGIIKDPDLMAELLEVPIPSFTNARASDMRRARSENEIMANEEAIVPGSWDNHAIHIREHNEYRKTLEFDTKSTEVKKRFEFHVERHKKLQMQEALEVAQLLAAQQGIAPGAPPPAGTQPGSPGTEATPEPGASSAQPQEQTGAPSPPGPAPPGAG